MMLGVPHLMTIGLVEMAKAGCRISPMKVLGVCDRCIVETMEEMLVEENPGLAPGDAVELVAEWFASDQEREH